ncbi:MAG: hypothetical protein IJK08_07430 [Prevotella sp.]|jgi:hypothetical protein|nr:hypothetical protein [Prevotella sp.]
MATARRMLLGLAMWLGTLAQAQTFSLQVENDSLAYLVLRTDSTTDRWRLAFPVYQICTGDVDGDGQEDALVGVVKSTRFDKKTARRLFIFKNHKGHIRPLWMGSQLGGILHDFKIVNGRVFTLQATTDGQYVVLEHVWRKFGLGAQRFIVKGVPHEEALQVFEHL